MSSRYSVFDLEADGLLDTVSMIWCGSFLDERREEVNSLSVKSPDFISELIGRIESSPYYLVGHNIIEYDFPMVEKVTGYRIKPDRAIDTLKLSKMFYPDIKGGHSIEAWGIRLGLAKPEHEDWSQFSDEMLYRNIRDVRINSLLFKKLIERGFHLPGE